MYLKGTGCKIVNWIQPTQDSSSDRLVWTCNKSLG